MVHKLDFVLVLWPAKYSDRSLPDSAKAEASLRIYKAIPTKALQRHGSKPVARNPCESDLLAVQNPVHHEGVGGLRARALWNQDQNADQTTKLSVFPWVDTTAARVYNTHTRNLELSSGRCPHVLAWG